MINNIKNFLIYRYIYRQVYPTYRKVLKLINTDILFRSLYIAFDITDYTILYNIGCMTIISSTNNSLDIKSIGDTSVIKLNVNLYFKQKRALKISAPIAWNKLPFTI